MKKILIVVAVLFMAVSAGAVEQNFTPKNKRAQIVKEGNDYFFYTKDASDYILKLSPAPSTSITFGFKDIDGKWVHVDIKEMMRVLRSISKDVDRIWDEVKTEGATK